MRLLLIEDEVDDCLRFSDCAKNRADIVFVGMTDSAEEGINLVKSRLPEGVILDLQLAKGSGSGLQFLELLSEVDLTLRPIVAITTSNQSEVVHKRVEELGADWFFTKGLQGYDENFIVDTMLSLRKALHVKRRSRSALQGTAVKSGAIVESPDDRRSRIYKRIDVELHLVGVLPRLNGHMYLRDAIYLQIHSDKHTGSCIEQVATNYNRAYGTVSKVMQTAITNAWEKSDIDELHTHYTARVSSETGVPSPSDFIHYYAGKIKHSI